MEVDHCNLNIPLHFLNNICRVCLTKSEVLIPMYEINLTHNLNPLGVVERIPLINVFEKYCGVAVSIDDNKPVKICESCMNGVCQAYNVFELFLQSNTLLDAKLNEPNVEQQEKQENSEQKDCVDDFFPNINSIISEDSGDNACFQVAFGNYLNKENIDSDNNSTILPVHKTEKRVDLTFDTDFININNEEAESSKSSTSDANMDHLDEKEVVHEIKPEIKPESSTEKTDADYGRQKEGIGSPPRFVDPKGMLRDHTYSVNESTFLRLQQRPYRKKRPPRPNKPKIPRIVKPLKILAPKRKQLESEEPENKIFKCTFCEVELEGMKSVFEHLKEKHFTENKCILCPRVMKRYDFLVKHVLSHSKYGVMCSRCLKYFKDKASLQLHKESADHKELIPCSICNKGYVSYRRLKFHMEGMHNPENKQRYQCTQCGVMTRWKHNLSAHMLTHQDREKRRICLCQFCGKGFYKVFTLNCHVKKVHEGHLKPRRLRSPREGTFQCKVCTQVFRLKQAFFTHWLSHPDVSVNCPYCDKVLDSPKAFKAHRAAEHRSIICEVCQKGFATENSLRLHRYQHRSNKIHRCGDCGLTYKTAQILKVHKLSHSGERPYECEICGKTFVQIAHKRQHKICMHPNKHRHKKFKCPKCGKPFDSEYSIANHMRSHTGEKPYSCPYCSKPYRDTAARHFHVKRHHPDKMDDFILYKSRHQKAENEKAKALCTANTYLTNKHLEEENDDK